MVSPAILLLIDLQIAPRGRIKEQCFVVPLPAQAAQMGKCTTLGLACVREEGACGADCWAEVLAVVASEILDAQLSKKSATARVALEVPGRTGANRTRNPERQRVCLVMENFGRGQPLQLGGERMLPGNLAHAEFAR